MEAWAQSITQVQFLCVCVETKQVAQMFDRMFRFEHAVNAYVPSKGYMPRGYGQLGCSGFIVSDAKGNFVSRKTKAYLDYGEDAFRHVEELLQEQLSLGRTMTTKMGNGGHVEEKKIDSSLPAEDYVLPSLGIASMDEEHESCWNALKLLLERPTTANLHTVLKELDEHFAHEEELMTNHGFGGGGGPLSALNSHVKDHQRILNLGRAELERLETVVASNSDCKEGETV